MRAPLPAALLVFAVAALFGAIAHPEAQGDRASRMRDHYSQVLLVHAAVIRGDLPAVVEPARDLVQRLSTSTAPMSSQPAVGQMKVAAMRAAGAKNLSGAAVATASMLKACGDCHRAAGVMPAAELRGRPEVGGIVGHMLEHQRAAEQMLQGLVVPSTTLWHDGALGFAGALLHPQDLPVNTVERRQMVGIEERLQRTAVGAADAPDGAARASAYAAVLSACADCHSTHAKVWGPIRGR